MALPRMIALHHIERLVLLKPEHPSFYSWSAGRLHMFLFDELRLNAEIRVDEIVKCLPYQPLQALRPGVSILKQDEIARFQAMFRAMQDHCRLLGFSVLFEPLIAAERHYPPECNTSVFFLTARASATDAHPLFGQIGRGILTVAFSAEDEAFASLASAILVRQLPYVMERPFCMATNVSSLNTAEDEHVRGIVREHGAFCLFDCAGPDSIIERRPQQ